MPPEHFSWAYVPIYCINQIYNYVVLSVSINLDYLFKRHNPSMNLQSLNICYLVLTWCHKQRQTQTGNNFSPLQVRRSVSWNWIRVSWNIFFRGRLLKLVLRWGSPEISFSFESPWIEGFIGKTYWIETKCFIFTENANNSDNDGDGGYGDDNGTWEEVWVRARTLSRADRDRQKTKSPPKNHLHHHHCNHRHHRHYLRKGQSPKKLMFTFRHCPN